MSYLCDPFKKQLFYVIALLSGIKSCTIHDIKIYMSRAMRKPILCHIQTTKTQISLRICAVWSAPLLFAA